MMEMGTGKEGARLLPTMPGAARVFGGSTRAHRDRRGTAPSKSPGGDRCRSRHPVSGILPGRGRKVWRALGCCIAGML